MVAEWEIRGIPVLRILIVRWLPLGVKRTPTLQSGNDCAPLRRIDICHGL